MKNKNECLPKECITDELYATFYYCCSCKESNIVRYHNYCPSCGRKINWKREERKEKEKEEKRIKITFPVFKKRK